jgi:hypothetical protein
MKNQPILIGNMGMDAALSSIEVTGGRNEIEPVLKMTQPLNT